jgi:hypothetical protein
MAKQTRLAAADKQAAFTAPEISAQEISMDDHELSYIHGVGVQAQHPAHDPSKPGKMPYELNAVPSAAV